MFVRRAMLWFAIVAGLLLAGCSTPPEKEISQAEGAIETARAAGAEQYAPDEFAAAVTALGRANEAVAARDYRLALNHAIDARERAQEAAKQASAQRAIVRSEVQATLSTIGEAQRDAAARLEAATTGRRVPAELQEAKAILDRVSTAVQEAGAAVDRGEDLAAQRSLANVPAQIEEAIRLIEAAAAGTPRPARRR